MTQSILTILFFYLCDLKEMVFYGVLDLCAKPVFALVHLYSLRSCNLAKLQLQSGKFSEDVQSQEKGIVGASSNNEAHENSTNSPQDGVQMQEM
jgi:bacteriorhodopsin